MVERPAALAEDSRDVAAVAVSGEERAGMVTALVPCARVYMAQDMVSR